MSQSRESGGVTEGAILSLASAVDDKALFKLGKELGLQITQVERYKQINRNTHSNEGTVAMLHAYRASKIKAEQIPALTSALNEAGLSNLIEIISPANVEATPGSSPKVSQSGASNQGGAGPSGKQKKLKKDSRPKDNQEGDEDEEEELEEDEIDGEEREAEEEKKKKKNAKSEELRKRSTQQSASALNYKSSEKNQDGDKKTEKKKSLDIKGESFVYVLSVVFGAFGLLVIAVVFYLFYVGKLTLNK